MRSGRLFRPILLLTLVGWSAGCGDPDAPPESERVALELVELWRGGDLGLAAELFTSTVVWADPAAGFEARGRPEVIAYLTEGSNWASSMFIDLVEIHASPGHATIEWIREGTTEPVGGGAPRRFQFEGATVIEVEGDRIVRGADYTDAAGLIVARGGRVLFPDGSELRPVTLEGDEMDDPADPDSIRGR